MQANQIWKKEEKKIKKKKGQGKKDYAGNASNTQWLRITTWNI